MNREEALTIVKNNLPDSKFTLVREALETLVPELKESEDEQHRKWIIEYLYDGLRKSDEQFKDQFKRAIAWLEKQGKNANFINKIQVGDKVTRNEDGVLVNLSQLERVANENEKQEEQKTDKVKPKFKVGDWIVSKGLYPSLIVDIDFDNDKYEIEFINGNREFVTIDYVDIIYHLWTIEDAKDGDVLTTDTWTFIFKKCKDGGVYYHCAISTFNEFSTSDTGEFNSNYVNPATKEQRDLLFQKMEEAGYKWDTEKKRTDKRIK